VNGRERLGDDPTRGRCCSGRCVGLRMVRIVETGKAVSNDLGSGSGGRFSRLLVSELLRRGSLGSSSRGPYGQVMLRFDRQRWLCARNYEDLFELVEVGRRVKLDKGVRLAIKVGPDGFDGADGKTVRVDLVATRGKDLLAGFDA